MLHILAVGLSSAAFFNTVSLETVLKNVLYSE